MNVTTEFVALLLAQLLVWVIGHEATVRTQGRRAEASLREDLRVPGVLVQQFALASVANNRWAERWDGGRQSAETRRKPRPGARGGGWPSPNPIQPSSRIRHLFRQSPKIFPPAKKDVG